MKFAATSFALLFISVFLVCFVVHAQVVNTGLVDEGAVPYQGDLILGGNDVYVIEGDFHINGSVIVEENATLILRDAVVNFTQSSDWQYNLTLRNPLDGIPRLQVTNTTIISNYKYSINLGSNSSTIVYDSQFVGAQPTAYCWLSIGTVSTASFYNFSTRGLSVFGNGTFIFNSSINDLNVYSGEIHIHNSQIFVSNTYASGVTWIYECTLTALAARDGSQQHVLDSTIQRINAYNETVVWLTNSSFTERNLYDSSQLFILWYLDTHVIDANSADVPDANVTAYYPDNSIADSELTDTNGWARLTLMEKMVNATGEYPVGNYTVTATYETNAGQQQVNMTANQQVTIQLPFMIPEFQTNLILTIFVALAFLAVAICRKRKVKTCKAHFASCTQACKK
ncbi:MAG: carboxypeptidase-like regulatory domain-containing protein [Candidatus Bathyarchaeia archaeon]